MKSYSEIYSGECVRRDFHPRALWGARVDAKSPPQIIRYDKTTMGDRVVIEFARINRSGPYYMVRNDGIVSRKTLVRRVGEQAVARFDARPVYEIAAVETTTDDGNVVVRIAGTARAKRVLSPRDVIGHFHGERLLNEYLQSWWPIPESAHNGLRLAK